MSFVGLQVRLGVGSAACVFTASILTDSSRFVGVDLVMKRVAVSFSGVRCHVIVCGTANTNHSFGVKEILCFLNV